MTKKALILTTAYLPLIGGSELAISEITQRLPDFDFDLVTGRMDRSIPESEQMGNVRIYRVGAGVALANLLLPKALLPLAIFLKARQLLKKENYLFIHAYQASQAAGAAWLLKWFYSDLPFILTIQEGKDLNRQSWLTRFFRKVILSKADIITVISNFLGDQVKAIKPKANILVIPNGVDPELLNIQPTQKDLLAERTVLTVSRLVEKNGVGDLIQAIALVNKTRPVTLLIAGSGHLSGQMHQQVKDLNIESKVRFLGTVPPDRLGTYFQQADVFVRPSFSEGLGSAFLEAMAAGVPIVGTAVGGIPDFLKEGETGIFCQPGVPADIAAKIIRVLSDQSLAEHLRENARTLVRDHYQWPMIAQQMNKLYSRFL